MSAPESYQDALASATRQVRAEIAYSVLAAHEIGTTVVRHLDRMIEARAIRLVEGERK